MINVCDLVIADVRYFDKEHNGLEYTPALSKVILLNRGDTYINLLNPGEIAPIYRRVENTTNILGTEDYFGTKIERVCGEENSGEAWLLNNTDFSKVFKSQFVSLDQVEDFVLRSGDFYHNRLELIEKRLKRRMTPRCRVLLIGDKLRDQKSKELMDNFFEERGCQKVYSK